MSETILETLMRPINGKVDFSTHNHHFIPWYWHLQKQLCLIGACCILREDCHCTLQCPPVDECQDILPHCRDKPLTSPVPLNEICSAQLDTIDGDEYISLLHKQHALFDRALVVIMDSLTFVQAATVFHIYNDATLSRRQKARDIIGHFRALYGTNEVQNTKPIINEMQSIPPATDCTSAEYLIGSLRYWNSALRLIHPAVCLDDVALIDLLLLKLQSSMFAYIVVKIRRPGVVFSVAVAHIENTITLYKQRPPRQADNVQRGSPTSVMTSFEIKRQSSLHSSSAYDHHAHQGAHTGNTSTRASCCDQFEDFHSSVPHTLDTAAAPHSQRGVDEDEDDDDDHADTPVVTTTPMKKWLSRKRVAFLEEEDSIYAVVD